MTREDTPDPPELTKEEKAELKAGLPDVDPVEAHEDQEEQSKADKERMLIARADPLVPLPSPGSVRHAQQKGPLAGEPDPLKPRDHEHDTEDRDPLVPDIPSVVADVPAGPIRNAETGEDEHVRQVDDFGRVESQEEADERNVAAEKEAAARRRKRKAAADEKAKKGEKALAARAKKDAEKKTMTKPNTETGANETKGGK